MNRIIVGSWDDAKRFELHQPYAVVSFTSTFHHRSAPKLKPSTALVRRIIIKADDALPSVNSTSVHRFAEHHKLRVSQPLDRLQARRIAAFVNRVAPMIDTLFIHCVFGEGRAPAAALSIAKAYGLPWKHYERDPYHPNPWIVELLDEALSKEP